MSTKKQEPNHGGERLLTKAQAAQALSVSERHLNYYLARGEIRAIRLGRSVRINPETLRKFIAERES